MDLRKYITASKKGPVLHVNEDVCLYDLKHLLFLVLDGMGGSGVGDIAAEKTAISIKDHYLKFSKDPDTTMPFYFNNLYNLELNSLINCLHFSHKDLFKENLSKDSSTRAAVTGQFASQAGDKLNIVSIGSGFCYLIRDRTIHCIYKNDLCLNSIRSSDKMSYVPMSPLGMNFDLLYFVKEFEILQGDRFVLGTDGAFSHLSDAEVLNWLSKKDLSMDKLEEVLELNNTKGNQDNQSVIILEY